MEGKERVEKDYWGKNIKMSTPHGWKLVDSHREAWEEGKLGQLNKGWEKKRPMKKNLSATNSRKLPKEGSPTILEASLNHNAALWVNGQHDQCSRASFQTDGSGWTWGESAEKAASISWRTISIHLCASTEEESISERLKKDQLFT